MCDCVVVLELVWKVIYGMLYALQILIKGVFFVIGNQRLVRWVQQVVLKISGKFLLCYLISH